MALPDEEPETYPQLVQRALNCKRQEKCLLAFVQAKQALGAITTADAETILATAQSHYRRHGILKDANNEATLTIGELQHTTAVVRQGVVLMEQKLVELHPELQAEVRAAIDPQRQR